MDFKPFAAAVAAQFALMSKHELFNVAITNEQLLAGYQEAFPPGTNPIYRERAEHDCSCCNNFVKNLGGVVAIIDGKIVTVWDIAGPVDAGYATVAARMADLVKTFPVTSLFRTSEKSYGAVSSKELLDDGKVRTWNHFHGAVATKHQSHEADKVVGEFNTTAGVFERGLKEFTVMALTEVVQLIHEKLLYRGDEFLKSVNEFAKLFMAYHAINNNGERNLFVMLHCQSVYARFRNTAIGTLVTDLSGIPERVVDKVRIAAVPPTPTDAAVKSFESKVAPENYKRPTSLVTKAMKDQALAKITELGLEDSLVRRFANIHDITINNVLWADGNVKASMKDGIAGIMDTIATKSVASTKGGLVTDIGIEDFMAKVLPKAKSIDMLVKNRHLTNLVAVTTGVETSSGNLFKWDNNFAWTYTGNISDSIKQRVKAAGGATDAVLRVSLAWHNGDDLDLHAYEPNGAHIYFGNRGSKTHQNRGMLDVDMNAGRAQNSKDPVENITWDTPTDGEYVINVNNFNLRSKSNVGYTLEVENNGTTHQYTCEQSPGNSQTHKSLVLVIKDRKVISIKAMKELSGGGFSQDAWGITTETPVRVNTVMLSPNYWDGNATGNKHYMFMLEGCKADEPLRGIMNEYLHPVLEAHRKVFEILGDKTKCAPTADQLAGLGFSSTKGDSVQVTVDASKHYNIIF